MITETGKTWAAHQKFGKKTCSMSLWSRGHLLEEKAKGHENYSLQLCLILFYKKFCAKYNIAKFLCSNTYGASDLK